MDQTLIEEPPTIRELGPDASAKVLVRAINERVLVHVRVDAGPTSADTALQGVLTGGDSKHLVLEIPDLEISRRESLYASELHVSMNVGGNRYEFATSLTRHESGPSAGTPLCVDLIKHANSDRKFFPSSLVCLRPTTIVLVDRRRSRRRNFMAPTEIILRPLSGRRTPDVWSCNATLLNLSVDGFACRVRESDAEGVAVGREIRAHFRVGTPVQEFALTSRVINRTQAGTAGHAVLGMEFVSEARLSDHRKRLRTVLGNAS